MPISWNERAVSPHHDRCSCISISEAQAAGGGAGVSIRELVLAGLRNVLSQRQRPLFKRVQFPLIVSKGPKVKVTNEHIHEHVQFP